MTAPRWFVIGPTFRYAYYMEYHAEQMARALCLHGLHVTVAGPV